MERWNRTVTIHDQLIVKDDQNVHLLNFRSIENLFDQTYIHLKHCMVAFTIILIYLCLSLLSCSSSFSNLWHSQVLFPSCGPGAVVVWKWTTCWGLMQRLPNWSFDFSSSDRSWLNIQEYIFNCNCTHKHTKLMYTYIHIEDWVWSYVTIR